MANPDKLIAMLKSRKASARYEACEELRVMEVIPDEARIALQAATNDPDRLVRDAAARALQAHETAQTPAPHAPPEAVRSGPRLSLALLGVAAMILVVLLCGVFASGRLSLVFLAYPLIFTGPGPGSGYLMFGFAYFVPFVVAYALPARMSRDRIRTLTLLSGCAAGLIYFVGCVLSSVYWS